MRKIKNSFKILKLSQKINPFNKRFGINVNHYRRQKNIKKLIPRKLLKFFPSRIIKEKGIVELIEACQSLIDDNIDLNLYIPSELSFHNRSLLKKEEAQNLRNKSWIKLLGQLPDLKHFYEDSHIVVLPSWREGLSMSLLEASSMECAIITTDVPGCNDIVEHGKSGLLVPLNNPISIRLAILF